MAGMETTGSWLGIILSIFASAYRIKYLSDEGTRRQLFASRHFLRVVDLQLGQDCPLIVEAPLQPLIAYGQAAAPGVSQALSALQHRPSKDIRIYFEQNLQGPTGQVMLPAIFDDDDDTAKSQAIVSALMTTNSMEKFGLELARLQDQYRRILTGVDEGESRTKTQVLLLWFCHAHMIEMLHFIQQIGSEYRRLQKLRLDSKLGPQLLDELINDARLLRKLSVVAENFSLDVESLIDSTDGISTHQHAHTEFGILTQELRGFVAELRHEGSSLPVFLEEYLRFLEMRRNMQESGRTWMLTVLASIFLPLSLACGILSMQTRLRDLHTLLYDFVGVVVLLLTLAGFLLVLVSVTVSLSEKIARQTEPWRTEPWGGAKKMALKIISAICLGNLWAIVLASFILGMAKEVRLGALILGYGVAALVGIGLVQGAIAWAVWRVWLYIF